MNPDPNLVEHACEVMHDAYEAAAVGAGWETQQASRKPWSEVPEANQATMRAAVGALLTWLPGHPLIDVDPEADALRRQHAQALSNSAAELRGIAQRTRPFDLRSGVDLDRLANERDAMAKVLLSLIDRPLVDRLGEAMALVDDENGCHERVREFYARSDEERENDPSEVQSDLEDVDYWTRRAAVAMEVMEFTASVQMASRVTVLLDQMVPETDAEAEMIARLYEAVRSQ